MTRSCATHGIVCNVWKNLLIGLSSDENEGSEVIIVVVSVMGEAGDEDDSAILR